MTSPRYSYSLAVGYNLPLGSLTNVETILDYNGKNLYPPQSFGSYLPGAPVIRLSGLEYERGFATLDWLWTGNGGKGIMTYAGARKLRTDYFGGNWSGTLSINSKDLIETSYTLYNAIGIMSKFPESEPNFKVFHNFRIRMTHLVAR